MNLAFDYSLPFVWFDIPATRLCGLRSVWMGTPNIQRSRIRKARRFIFFRFINLCSCKLALG